ncbi:hypothetical protein BD289DRAFT_453863 [Coniella lustricola]|uniref:Uncharacterized protein n=1 Tax=Coniella lustricola TaxID=2025994 RepID=A0A2T3A5W3_9PEZI|nr:hypothetical protein BD289DRAFT_453863 [Coniella lustricola]
MGWTLEPKVQALLRLRVRHIHLPDTPPLYAPRFLIGRIRDHVEAQIRVQRLAAEQASEPPARTVNKGPKEVLRAWLKTAGPPPTVLTFTRRPTYVLPKHYVESQDAWAADYMTASLQGQLRVSFPKPPRWSRCNWIPNWQDLKKHQRPADHDPLDHAWDPGVMVMPCKEPMYFGPGQLSIWPIIDLADSVQKRRQMRNKFEFERLLEDTTIAVLKREYGIEAFAIAGSPGVWVDSVIPPPEVSSFEQQPSSEAGRSSQRRFNTRRIATVHADAVNDISRFGVSIHVGQPGPALSVWSELRNPWNVLRQAESTTSIAAELAQLGTSPHHREADRETAANGAQGIDRKSKYLQTEFDTTLSSPSLPVKAMPYSQVVAEPGRREPMPLGMDNRDLATAWTGEFARQLGMRDGLVDHYSTVPGTNGLSSVLAPRGRSVGFMSRPLETEYKYAEPYEQVNVPLVDLAESELMTPGILDNTIRLASKDGLLAQSEPIMRAVSWPLYYKQLGQALDNSIKDLALDKRLAHITARLNEAQLIKMRALKQKELQQLQLQQLLQQQQQQQQQQPQAQTQTTTQPQPQPQPREQKVQEVLDQPKTLETAKQDLSSLLQELRTSRPSVEPLVDRIGTSAREMQTILRNLELGGVWKRRLFNSTLDVQDALKLHKRTSRAEKGDNAETPADAPISGVSVPPNNPPRESSSPPTPSTAAITTEAVESVEAHRWISNLEKAMRSSSSSPSRLSSKEVDNLLSSNNAHLANLFELLDPASAPTRSSPLSLKKSPKSLPQGAPESSSAFPETRGSELKGLESQVYRRRTVRSLYSPRRLQDWVNPADSADS